MEFVTWASWFSGHRFKLEAEDFFLHIPQRSFPNFSLEILALCSARSLQSFFFFLILFSAGIHLLKDWLKRSQNENTFFLFPFSSSTSLFKLIETIDYSSKMDILTNKASLVLIFFHGLHISCKTY